MLKKLKRVLGSPIHKRANLCSLVKRKLLGLTATEHAGLQSIRPIIHDPSSFERDQRVYREHTSELFNNPLRSDAYAKAIGSANAEEFIFFGKMEADLLYQYGLSDESFLVDVGCGSGRLASALATRFNGTYLGTDISPILINHARGIVQRNKFEFVETIGLTIPVANNSVDFACFFSVLTHLRHEESYLFLENAVRSLKSAGKIIFSFLDFSQSSHWTPFEHILNALRDGKPSPVNQMMSHDTIYRFAQYLGVEVIAIHDGATPYIINTEPKVSGHNESLVSLGQSVCVLRKR